MIRLERKLPPDDLRDKLDAIKADIAQCLREQGRVSPDLVKKYGKLPPLRQLLILESHGKCAYCESRVVHVSFPHIEHIKPKSVYPELAVSLENLTLACAVCNTFKGAYNGEDGELLDPFLHDCYEELVFSQSSIEEDFCSDRGITTLEKLKLDRDELEAERKACFDALKTRYLLWKKETQPIKKKKWLKNLWLFALPPAEYSSMCLMYLALLRVPSHPEIGVKARPPKIVDPEAD